MNAYQQFLQENAWTTTSNECTVWSISNKTDTCIVRGQDRDTMYLLPIKVLISDVRNNMIHVHAASKLKTWKRWDEVTNEDMYPDDYFLNTGKYVLDVSEAYWHTAKSKLHGKLAQVST